MLSAAAAVALRCRSAEVPPRPFLCSTWRKPLTTDSTDLSAEQSAKRLESWTPVSEQLPCRLHPRLQQHTAVYQCNTQHTLSLSPFYGHFPGGPGLAANRMSPFWILLELRGGGDNWSYKTCKAPVKMSPSAHQHPVYYRSDALPVTQLTAAMHWRESNAGHWSLLNIVTSGKEVMFSLCLFVC